ncbi:MAG: hypothetical protein KDK48_03015 [Chlamydiia bacterium]|nr:hypothetical protein [Chlamydiia bacterium]
MKSTVRIKPQPTESTCGPTCLQAVYDYYGLSVDLNQIIKDVPKLEEGGTLAVMLGVDALKRGFGAEIITFNLQVFDPSWFYPKKISSKLLQEKLKLRSQQKKSAKVATACKAYDKFLNLGGKLEMDELNGTLLRHYLKKGIPLLTGLSSTFLYQTKRTRASALDEWVEDDTGGDPEGHFVILEHYNQDDKTVTVVDPYGKNPFSRELKYDIGLDRLITSILLGVLTYDANLLVISKNQ